MTFYFLNMVKNLIVHKNIENALIVRLLKEIKANKKIET